MNTSESDRQSERPDRGFYVQDVDFPSGFINPQMPALMAYVAALRGFEPPDPSGVFRYCELGCSTGVTLNTLAAANPQASFVGIDFNTESIAKARTTADQSGLSNVEYVELSFTDIDPDLFGKFDYVSIQGAYSWLSDDVVKSVIRFLEASLAPGGLFYVEFLLLPAMASLEPVARLMRELGAQVTGGSLACVEHALDKISALNNDKNAHFFKHHPVARKVVSYWLRERERNSNMNAIIAHASLSGSWVPKYVTEVAEELSAAGLRRAGSTMLALNDLELSLLPDHLALVSGIEDPLLVELLADYIQHRNTRRDIFVKAQESDPVAARKFLVEKIYFMLRHPAAEVQLIVNVPGRGKVSLDGHLYQALLRAFESPGARLCDLLGQGAFSQITDDAVIRATAHIIASDDLLLCLRPPIEVDPISETSLLKLASPYNRFLLNQLTDNMRAITFASHVTGGGGITLPVLDALLLKIWIDEGSEEIVSRAYAILQNNHSSIWVNKEFIPAKEITWGMLCSTLATLKHRRVQNLARLGIIEVVNRPV